MREVTYPVHTYVRHFRQLLNPTHFFGLDTNGSLEVMQSCGMTLGARVYISALYDPDRPMPIA